MEDVLTKASEYRQLAITKSIQKYVYRLKGIFKNIKQSAENGDFNTSYVLDEIILEDDKKIKEILTYLGFTVSFSKENYSRYYYMKISWLEDKSTNVNVVNKTQGVSSGLVIGGALGALAGGPVGAVIGGIIGDNV